ncbi:MAG: hypothetical protein JW774_04825 [Candidatus Aureabacteria bacterium]|nr:hypothetical protein [Candidatus Auribacterota bacterium]
MPDKLSKKIELEIEHEPRIIDLIRLYHQIKEQFELPLITLESIFYILFVEKYSLIQKMIEIAKLLIVSKEEEMNLKLVNKTQQTICEIVSHTNLHRLNCIRVLHYFSDHTHGLTQMIFV